MTGLYDGGEIVAVLPVADVDRAEAWYGRLGFTAVGTYAGYRILAAGDLRLHLATSDHEPGTSTTAVYLYVADAEAVHAAWAAVGARVLQAPEATPYGLVEFAAVDPDGNLWRVGSPVDRPGGEGPTGGPGGGVDIADVQVGATGAANGTVDVAAGSGDAGPPTDGSAGTGEASWYAVVAGEAACAGCGWSAGAGSAGALSGQLRDQAHRWRRVLLDADDEAVRHRPTPGTWSALEYGAHVRDTVSVFTERILRTLAEEDPELGWWDHEAAVEDGFVNESHVETVADDLDHNATRLRDVLGQVHGDQWARRATRRGDEAFTVELLARFVLHEVVHHLHDAEASLAAASEA